MRIIEFRGGLGNQLFEYAHYLYLKKKYPQERFFGYYPSRELWQHNGLEIQKRFRVDLPIASKWIDLISWVLFSLNRKFFSPKKIKCPWLANDFFPDENAFLQEGYWESSKYFKKDFRYEYLPLALNAQTEKLMSLLNDRDVGYVPVCVHVRRGDYLLPENYAGFSGICTDSYYQSAMEYMISYFGNIGKKVRFFFFSDDIEYINNHFVTIEDKIIVDWNQGPDAFQDMYLMSHFPAMILANSTFSFWSAQNNKLSPLVICPPKLNNLSYDTSVAMPDWIVIDGIGKVTRRNHE